MILINLLPHREIAREQARKAFINSAVLAAIFGLAISGLIYMWYQNEISTQENRNKVLAEGIAKLDEEIKEVATLESEIAALQARQEAVESLQSNRNLSVHLLNDAVRELPEGIYFRVLEQKGNDVLGAGVAQSNERISELLRNYQSDESWLSKPQLVEIIAGTVDFGPREKKRVNNFTVRSRLEKASAASEAQDEQSLNN